MLDHMAVLKNVVDEPTAGLDPGNGFAAVEAGLQDVYFSTLAHARRAA